MVHVFLVFAYLLQYPTVSLINITPIITTPHAYYTNVCPPPLPTPFPPPNAQRRYEEFRRTPKASLNMIKLNAMMWYGYLTTRTHTQPRMLLLL